MNTHLIEKKKSKEINEGFSINSDPENANQKEQKKEINLDEVQKYVYNDEEQSHKQSNEIELAVLRKQTLNQ